jgi:riboflavin synthase
MFTGIVEEIGTVATLTHGHPAARLTVNATLVTQAMQIGDSIAVDGICLTIVAFDSRGFTVEVQAETLARTRCSQYRPGTRINLERALTPHSRMGGHYVQGHVDDVGVVRSWRREGADWVLRVSMPPALQRYVVIKGFVALNGISLTVTKCGAEIEVHVIPHTRQATTLADMRAGDLMNIEVDVIAKYVESLLKR